MSPYVTVLVLGAEAENRARTVAELRELGFDASAPDGPQVGAAGAPLVVLDLQDRVVIVGSDPLESLTRPFSDSALRAAMDRALARQAAQTAPSDDRYRDLVENSYDLLCTHDVYGTLLSVNAAAEKALGYPRETLVGRHLQELLVPETQHLFPNYLEEILEKGSSHGVMRMRTATGEMREWEYHNSERRLEDGKRIIRGLAHDVTEQLKAARELRASEQKFRALFEQAAVGVAYIDTTSETLLGANRKCGQILGYSEAEFLTQRFASLINRQDLPGYDQMMRQLALGELTEFTIELRLLDRRGVDVWVALSVSAVSPAGSRKPHHMVVVQDISQRKLAEMQREQLEAQLRQAQKMEAIGTLAGGIAHDFNNLLTTMVGNVELARLDVEPSHPVYVSLDAIATAARRATDLVRQILAFSRKQPMRREVIALGPIIEDSMRLLRASLPASVEIELHLDDGAPLVLADATQIHQVIMNLCTNAWQAITKGRGHIDISLDAFGNYARLTVRDTGEGMDARTLERIFEPFFTTKELGRGSGLGLSVAHGIVRDHGGTITARSRAGEGATFEVLLPAADAATATATEPEETLPLFGQGRVLYVDDEKALGLAVARMLDSLGYEVTVCHSGTEALGRFRANPQGFDVVLTDLSMPGMTGTDVARELQRIRPGLPIILTSGFAERATENLAAVGIRMRLDKPFDRRALSEALNQVLASSIKATG